MEISKTVQQLFDSKIKLNRANLLKSLLAVAMLVAGAAAAILLTKIFIDLSPGLCVIGLVAVPTYLIQRRSGNRIYNAAIQAIQSAAR